MTSINLMTPEQVKQVVRDQEAIEAETARLNLEPFKKWLSETVEKAVNDALVSLERKCPGEHMIGIPKGYMGVIPDSAEIIIRDIVKDLHLVLRERNIDIDLYRTGKGYQLYLLYPIRPLSETSTQ
jgi:hypothetical protein